MTTANAIKRLTQLANLLQRYAHRFGVTEEATERLCNWANEFDTIKRNHEEAFDLWLVQSGYGLNEEMRDLGYSEVSGGDFLA